MKLVIVWRVWEHHEFVHVRDEGFLYQLSRFFFLIVGANGSVFPILRRKPFFLYFFFAVLFSCLFVTGHWKGSCLLLLPIIPLL